MRYAIIDNASGYVWWVGDAADPISACHAADREVGAEPRVAEIASGARPVNESGYWVYAAPADFAVDDGQDENAILATEELPLAAYVRMGSA